MGVHKLFASSSMKLWPPSLIIHYFYKGIKIFEGNGHKFFPPQLGKNRQIVHDETSDIEYIHNISLFLDMVHRYRDMPKYSSVFYTRAYFSSFFSEDLSGTTISFIFILLS